MPWVDWQFSLGTKVFEPLKLIIDQRPQWPYVNEIKSTGTWMFQNRRNQRQERCLRLSARRCGGNDQIVVSIQQYRNRLLLNVVQARPSLTPDPAANGVCQKVKRGRPFRA